MGRETPYPSPFFRYNQRLMLKAVIDWYLGALQTGGYPLIALLMAMESSIIPLPSEVVIPPAAYLASTNQAHLNIVGIVLAGTVGSWFGATAMYWVARLAGRPLLVRYGKYVRITADKITGAESWSMHYGWMGIFVSRLLPVVRHLIGIPAGGVRRRKKHVFFFFFSALSVVRGWKK